MLEKVRMLSNLEARKSKLLQTVLVGQPELALKLEQPRLRQLRQRVAVRFDIPAMTEERTLRYIEHRLRVVGAPDRGLFTPDALRRIHAESGGIPRMVNVICSNALLLGLGGGKSRLEESTIEEVVRDLKRGVPAVAAQPAAPAAPEPEGAAIARVPAPDASLHESLARAPKEALIARPVPPPPGDQPLTAEEAAEYLRVSPKTARQLLRSGAIPASKVGRGWRVFRRDLDDHIRSRGRAAGPERRPEAAARPEGPERAERPERDLGRPIERVFSEARDAYGPPEEKE
ncbi:MAG: helix-turn-helix domain-containing protein [Candidatus Latescibacterota bacterium]|nr:MAG: helix-turn-helix domain-containing protein [Candidatus Latescibacterota bacterium]